MGGHSFKRNLKRVTVVPPQGKKHIFGIYIVYLVCILSNLNPEIKVASQISSDISVQFILFFSEQWRSLLIIARCFYSLEANCGLEKVTNLHLNNLTCFSDKVCRIGKTVKNKKE